jgi:hypothetical protein
MMMSARLLALALLLAVLAFAAGHPTQPLADVLMENLDATQELTGTVTVSPSVVSGLGETVIVSWSGVAGATSSGQDWIGVWSPEPADYSKVAPVKYKFVSSDSTGSGSTELWLLNMREEYHLAYFTGGTANPTLRAEIAQPVTIENPDLPLMIHLAYADSENNGTSMVVSWNSRSYSNPMVRFGLSPENLDMQSVSTRTDSYNRSDMCGGPGRGVGWHEPGWFHDALLEGLQTNTQYFYQIVDDGVANSTSDISQFYTAPHHGADIPVNFIIFGDLGQGETDGSNEHTQMAESVVSCESMATDLAEGDIDRTLSPAVFHIGDISYARGYGTLWEQFFYQIRNVSHQLPWMVTAGNHERDWPQSGSFFRGNDSGGECGVPYSHRFAMPNGHNDQYWYSLIYGPIHFVFISTEHSVQEGSPQFQWLQDELENRVDRSKTPFLLVAGHRPMYISSTGGMPKQAEQFRAAVEPILIKHNADAAFWGHHHSYQRTCALNNYNCVGQSNGIIHIVTGAGGTGPSPTAGNKTWLEFLENSYNGYVRAYVRDNTLSLKFVESQTRVIRDQIDIPSKFPTKEAQEFGVEIEVE